MKEECLAKLFNTNAIPALYIVSHCQTYTYSAAVTWLKYHRYGVKLYPIKHMFLPSLSCSLVLFHTQPKSKPLHPRPPTINTRTYINKIVHLQFIFLQLWINTFYFWYSLTLSVSSLYRLHSIPPGVIKSFIHLYSLNLFNAQ